MKLYGTLQAREFGINNFIIENFTNLGYFNPIYKDGKTYLTDEDINLWKYHYKQLNEQVTPEHSVNPYRLYTIAQSASYLGQNTDYFRNRIYRFYLDMDFVVLENASGFGRNRRLVPGATLLEIKIIEEFGEDGAYEYCEQTTRA